jgi:hypothetical protein
MTSALPQLAFGGGWHTSLYFSNTTERVVSVEARFLGNRGAPLRGTPFESSRTVHLSPGATVVLEAPDRGPLVTGWAEAVVPAGVIVHGVLRHTVSGRPDPETVLALTPVSSPTAVFIYDGARSSVTAAAILNPGSQPVLMTIAVYRDDGALVGLEQMPLQPRSKRAEILENLPGLAAMAGTRGRVLLSSPNRAVSVLALRLVEDVFASIPVSHH